MKHATWIAVAAGLTAALAERPAAACAGCSNPNLPSGRAESTMLAPGEVSMTFNLTATTMHVVHSEYCPDIGPICVQRDEPPQLHDQRFYVGELRPIIALGLTNHLGLELQAPFRVVKTTIQFRRLDGTPFEPDYANIHHRNETLAGVTDPWLLGRGNLSLDNLLLVARAGVGVPLGSTEEDPFARGRAGLPHQHIQFGTGTFYPVLALDLMLDLKPVRLIGYGQTLLFLYENGHGYQSGNRYMGGASAQIELAQHLRAGPSIDVINEQPERWAGTVQQDGNVGRTDVLLGAAASYRIGTVTASLSVKTPVYQHFIETAHDDRGEPGQLTYPAIVNLAVQTSFGGRDEVARESTPR